MTADDDGPIPTDTLVRHIQPPPDLEPRIAARLAAAGLIRTRRPRWLTPLAAAAAFVLGLLAGRVGTTGSVGPTHDDRARFLLLLHAGEGARSAPVDEATAVREYGAWASAERRAGRHIEGERLADRALAVDGRGVVASDDTAVQGYFVVTAANADEAARLASGSPHVRHGGRVVVRAIDTPR